jgi:glycosyltransferase involved in cell wall biosynthesis
MDHYRIAFVIEHALGHRTHAANLQANVQKDSAVEAQWLDIPFETRGLAKLPFYKSNWTWRGGWRTRRALGVLPRSKLPDALFFHTQVLAFGAADWVKRIPSVISLDATPLQNDVFGEFYGHKVGRAWFEALKRRLYDRCFRAAHCLVTWSEWTKKGLIEEYGIPAYKVFVIPPGVNLHEWKRPAPRALHPGPVKILFVGSDFKRKGGSELLEAFRALSSLGVELHLVTRDNIAAEAGVSIYTDLRPNSPQLRALYHACDIFCLPTHADFFAMVLVEAGAAGLPVVSTEIAAIPEIVKGGVNGFLVPPGDVGALAQALRPLVQDVQLRLQMGECGSEIVAEKFDAARNTVQLLGLIKQIVNQTRQVNPRYGTRAAHRIGRD